MISKLKEFIPINSLGYVSSLIENEKKIFFLEKDFKFKKDFPKYLYFSLK